VNALWQARPSSPLRLVETDTPQTPYGEPGMPCDPDLEAGVLGAILISDRILPVLAVDEGLAPVCFYRVWHRHVYTAMLTLHSRGDPVDTATVRHELAANGMPAQHADRVELLPGQVANLGNVRAHAARLVELAGWRMVKRAGTELVAAADMRDTGRRERAEGMLRVPAKHTSSQDGEQLASMLFDHLNGGQVVKVLPLVFHGLAGPMAGGLRESETTLLGGWTSMGKSACLDTILTHAARHGCRTHLYINEMTVKVRSMRILAAEAKVSLSRLLNRQTMQSGDAERATTVLKRGMPFGITDVFGWTAEEIARDIRLRGWELVGVDILHLIPHREVKDLDEISQTLTLAAKSSGAHLVATVHLNEERAKSAILPPPVIRDIRGSGMLKNNADNVLFVHREQEADNVGVVRMLDDGVIAIAKCRNGALGGVAVEFEGRYVRYREVGR
jgi:replicative DNA helicase